MKKMIAIILLFILTSPSLSAINNHIPSHANYTEIEITPNNYTGNFTGPELITLSIYVTPQDSTQIDTVSTDEIYFTPETLQCEEITWGNIFTDSTFRIKGTIDNVAGTISDMVWGSTNPTTDPGYFCNMTFNITNPGSGSVIIDSDYAGVAYGATDLPVVVTHNFTLGTESLFVSDEYPDNESINNPINLQLGIDIFNTEGNSMDMYWVSNTTGEWRTLDREYDVPNGRYNTSCYGVIESPYNQELRYQFGDYNSNIYNNNSCPASDLGYIKDVEIYTSSSVTFRPIFDGFIEGQTYSGSGYTDITTSTNAPTIWTWDDIKNLDLYSSSSTNAEVVVTYDLGYGEGERIDWSVNLTDGSYWVNESYWYITEIESPVVSNPSPYDTELCDSYNPELSIDAYDPNGDSMSIKFYYDNGTGWEQIGSTQTGGNGTYSQLTDIFTTYGETYYWKVSVNDGHGHSVNMTYRFTLREIQDAPYDFEAHTFCDSQMNLSWTKPDYVDYVRIQRRTDNYPTTISDGLNIYNGTSEIYYDTSVTPGTIYYYSIWSYNSTDNSWSSDYSTSLELTAPSNPTSFTATTVDYNTINLNWNKGTGAMTTLIRRKTGSYPTDKTDGTLVYEGEDASYTDDSLGSNTSYYYRAWAHYHSGIYEPKFENDGTVTGNCLSGYTNCGFNDKCSQSITIPEGESLYCTEVHVYISIYNCFGDSASRSYARVYLTGPGIGTVLLDDFIQPDNNYEWVTIDVPNLYLRGGETYSIQVQHHDTCSPSCCYCPKVDWGMHDGDKIYRVYGYYGYYSCGYDQDTTTTDVGPPLVTTNSANNLENYTARIRGYLNADGGEDTTVGLIWENETGSYNTTIGTYSRGSSFYLDVDGLLKGTTYSFKAWAQNAYGYVEGDELAFNTKPEAPSELKVDNSSNTEICISWVNNLGSDETMVRYKESSYPVSISDGEGGLVSGNNSCVDTLTPNATYYFRIWAYNQTESLYSTEYQEINQITSVGTPEIDTISTINIDNYDATIRATLIDDAGEQCTCGFRWGTSSGSYTNNQTVGIYETGETLTLSIDSLSKGTRYYYKSWAENSMGFSYGDEEWFETRPEEPTSFTAVAYGARQINLSWINGQGADSVLIKKKSTGYPSSTSDGTTVYSGSGTSYIDNLLNENSKWYYRIWSYCNSNSLYSTATVIDNATTGFLPNVTFMSPCGDTNINRPPVLQGICEGNSPLTYTFYGYSGEAQRILGDWSSSDVQWVDGTWINEWDNVGNVLSYSGSTIGDFDVGRPMGYGWSEGIWRLGPVLHIGFEDVSWKKFPRLITGIELNDNWNELDGKFYADNDGGIEVSFHEYYSDTWITQRKQDGDANEWNLGSPTYVDQIEIRYGQVYYDQPGSGSGVTYVELDSVEFYLPPETISVNESVTSGETRTCIWENVTSENQGYMWCLEVSDGIDTDISCCTFYTEGTTISDVSPTGDVINYPTHDCSFTVNHSNGKEMDVYFYYYNYSESDYDLGGQSLDTLNNSFTFTYPNSNNIGTTYTWEVRVWDGTSWHNETFTFDVSQQRIIFSDISPSDGSTVPNTYSHNCSLNVSHISEELMDIILYSYNGTGYIIEKTYNQVEGGVYYFIFDDTDEYGEIYQWRVNATDNNGSRIATYDFSIRTEYYPSSPDFDIVVQNATSLKLENISGDSRADTIMIRADSSSYPDKNSGRLLFNGTLTEYTDLGLIPLNTYYYSAWSYNETDGVWSSVTQKSETTAGPIAPSFDLSRYNKSRINIYNINKNIYSDSVYIRAKKNSEPTDRTDGLFICNTTLDSFNAVGLDTASHYYFSAWTYNTTYGIWSTDSTIEDEYTNGGLSISSISPENDTQIDGINPLLSVYVNDYNTGESITVYFRSNVSGSWDTIRTRTITEPNYANYQSSEFQYQDSWYWWSVNATDGEFWDNSTQSFKTGSMDVPDIKAHTFNVSQINLSWSKSDWTTHTWIQRKIDDYPTSRSDGTNIYFDTGEYFEDTDLEPGELYRYTIWTYNATLDVYSTNHTFTQNVTKPYAPVNFTSTKWDYTSINLTWEKGIGAEKTYIMYKPDNYPNDRDDGTLIYHGNNTWHLATGLMPDDYLNYYSPNPGTDNFGVYVAGGDPFEYSCDDDETTKWDLNESTTGNFSYELGIEPQRVKGFAILYQDFYNDPGTDWESSISGFDIYNGTWHNDWTGELYNQNESSTWHYYESPTYYDDVTEVRFSAWTEWITPDIYEVLVGKLGYVHCFKAWSSVTKGGITQFSDESRETENKTEDTPNNKIPEISNMNPSNNSNNLNLNPELNVTINDPEGQLMNISWQYWNGTKWLEFDTTTLVGNGTYSVTPVIFDGFSTTYNWRVTVSDTSDVEFSAIQENTNISEEYYFTIRDAYIPDEPLSFNAETAGYYKINLTMSFNSDMIYIERNSTTGWMPGEGTFVYLGNLTEYQDTGLNHGTNYHYQIWGYNTTDNVYSSTYLVDNATTLDIPNEEPYAPITGYVTTPRTTDDNDYLDVYEITMHCTVIDPDNDSMNVSFYWSDDTLIGTVNNVDNGTEAQLFIPTYSSPAWLEHDIDYNWYAVADDGIAQNTSNNWNFYTCHAWDLNVDRQINYLDISIIVAHYLETVSPSGSETYDINNDGTTNYLDLSSVVAHYLEVY